jgi:hypothetical protein
VSKPLHNGYEQASLLTWVREAHKGYSLALKLAQISAGNAAFVLFADFLN